VVATGVGAMRAATSPESTWSALPHFRGVRIGRAEQAQIQSRASRMASVLGPAPFLLNEDNGLYYLVAGLKNPTPFDEPHVMNFGIHGQADVVRALAAGTARPVCMGDMSGPLEPSDIVRYVRSAMTPGDDLGVCVVYR
ncbi:MAG TPA: hypothetical protein VG871_01840, partial [Vicinamibacterales bacterium]|nr:hypothetical protein [Vicinamibacterales bacterium]